jgi:hypothetical protein
MWNSFSSSSAGRIFEATGYQIMPHYSGFNRCQMCHGKPLPLHLLQSMNRLKAVSSYSNNLINPASGGKTAYDAAAPDVPLRATFGL